MSIAPVRETVRRGPRPEYVRDESGREIFGLRMMTISRKDAEGRPIVRYYSDTPEGKRLYHGDSRDKAVAVYAFRQWESAQTGEAIRVTVNAEPSPDVKRAWEHYPVRMKPLAFGIRDDGDRHGLRGQVVRIVRRRRRRRKTLGHSLGEGLRHFLKLGRYLSELLRKADGVV